MSLIFLNILGLFEERRIFGIREFRFDFFIVVFEDVKIVSKSESLAGHGQILGFSRINPQKKTLKCLENECFKCQGLRCGQNQNFRPKTSLHFKKVKKQDGKILHLFLKSNFQIKLSTLN